MLLNLLSGIILVLIFSNFALSASFDCHKAQTPIEKAICADKEISELDSMLAEAYRKNLLSSPNQADLKAAQRDWMRNHRDTCGNTDCVRAAYNKRLNDLKVVPQVTPVAQAQAVPKQYTKAASTQNINTKLLIADLQICSVFLKRQFHEIMQFLNSLSPGDIDLLNKSPAYNPVQIINTRAEKILTEINKKMHPHNTPTGLSKNNNAGSGIPRNFFGSNMHEVSSYRFVLKDYQIPQDDLPYAISEYAKYTIFALDQLQLLMEKVDALGLKLQNLPSINGVHITTVCPLFLASSDVQYVVNDPKQRLCEGVMHDWKFSTQDIPILIENSDALMAQKAWLEFLITRDFVYVQGESKKRDILLMITELEKRMALGKSTQRNQTPVETQRPQKSQEKQPANKFKLELPD